MRKKCIDKRKRLFEIIEVGFDLDYVSRGYDIINALAIIFNLTVSILHTFEHIENEYGAILLVVENITVVFFSIDYIFRIVTAKFLYPKVSEGYAILKYIVSFSGIVDLFSVLPYYLPLFFPAGTVAFRMIRIIRIFRLFRINAYNDSLSIIAQVIASRKQQLISSVFIILILMIASSLCMYSLENEVQPEVFQNAFSGIWWAVSTLLTVGYGDIYPITTLGKLFGIFIAFLGVGMVAIPTGIISAGFVDQYANIKKREEYGYEADMNFIKIQLEAADKWVGMRVMELDLPSDVIITVIKRGSETLIPRGDVLLKTGDIIVLGAEPFDTHEHIELTEIVIQKQNPWANVRVRDLDISRHSIIVLIKRKNKSLIPHGNMVVREEDHIFMYTKLHYSEARHFEV